MPKICIMAAAATVAALAFALSPATARSCDDGEAGCVSTAQTAPMKLDNFMKTWKPVAKSKRVKKPKAAARQPVQERPAPEAEPAVAEAPPAEAMSALAESPEQTVETDGVAVTSFDEVNAIDTAANQVQIVAFNEINEIDLAAPAPPAPAETAGQSLSTGQAPADNSWVGKLLLAAAGTIALAGATRLLIA